MKCPGCDHVSAKAIYQCPNCGGSFDRSIVETLGHLEFLNAWISANASTIRSGQLEILLKAVNTRMAAIRPGHAPSPAPAIAPPGVAAPAPSRVMAAAPPATAAISATAPVQIPPPPPFPVATPARASAPAAAPARPMSPQPTAPSVSAAPAVPVTPKLPLAPSVPARPPAKAAAPGRAVTPAKPAAPIAPPIPAAPKAPPIDWGKVWAKAVDLAVSGALLRGLLFLGAFMIVVSATVLVWVSFPSLPMAMQLAIVAALPLPFYAAGWFLRARLKLPFAGTVFTGIGALLVAVDCIAVYQFGGFESVVGIRAYWFIASCLCTVAYALTAWGLPREFFGYIALAGISSSALAFTQWLLLPWGWGWGIAVVAAVNTLTSDVAARTRPAGPREELLRAARRWPLAILPVTQAAAILVPDTAPSAQMATFALAAIAYGLRAWRTPHQAFAHAAAWSSLMAMFFGLRSTPVPWQWYPAIAGAVSPIYLLAAHRINGLKRADSWPFRAYAMAIFITGFGLLVAGMAVAPSFLLTEWWAGVTGLLIPALVFAWCAYLLHQDRFALIAAGLFVIPFTLTAARLQLDAGVAGWFAWTMVAWSGLGMVYLAGEAALRKAGAYARWLNLCSQGLMLTAAGALVAAYVLPGSPPDAPFAGMVGFALVTVGYGLRAWRSPNPAFAHIAAWSSLVAIFLGLRSAPVPWQWYPAIFGALSPLYILAAHRINRLQRADGWPVRQYAEAFFIAGFGVLVGAVGTASTVVLTDWWAGVTGLLIPAVVLVWCAYLLRQDLFVLYAAGLFIAPFSLTAARLQMDAGVASWFHWTMVAWTGLGMVYLAGEAALHKANAYARWLTLCSHGLMLTAAVALIGAYSLPGSPPDAPVAGMVGLALVTLGYGLRAWRAPNPAFAHIAAWSSIVAIFFGLRNTAVPWQWYPAIAGGLSPAYIAFARRMVRLERPNAAMGWAYAAAFAIAGFSLVAIGLMSATAALLTDLWAGVAGLLIPAVVLGWCAYFLRRDFFVVLAAGLFVAPFSLAGARLLHDAGTAGWLPWVVAGWIGLGLVYLAAAAALHRFEAYARWLNLSSHGLTLLAAQSLIAGFYSFGWPSAAAAGGLTLALVVYGTTAVMHHTDRFPAISKYLGLLPPSAGRTVVLWAGVLIAPFWLHTCWALLAAPRPWLGAALVALAAIYVAGGELLARLRAEYRRPPSLAAHVLPLVGCAAAMPDAWALFAALALTTGVYAGLTFVYRQRVQPWLAVLASGLAMGQMLLASGVQPVYYAASWAALAWIYLLLERFLARAGVAEWMGRFRLPLGVAAVAVWALGLALTVNGTVDAFLPRGEADHAPVILAQALAAGLTVVAAWQYRSRIPLLLEPWLGIVPVSLFFAGYGASIFGRPLSPPEYAYVWMGFALVQVVAAVAVDRQPVRYAHGLWIGAYGLAAAALLRSMPDRVANIWVLAACIGIALLSQALVHRGRHGSFADLDTRLWRGEVSAPRVAFRIAFLFLAVYSFPLWLVQLMTHLNAAIAWQGLGLAMVAPAYVAAGLLARRSKPEYNWPLYSAAYVLTAIGAMVSFDNEAVAIGVLVLDAAVYAASAYIFRQPFWLYLSNALAPVIGLLYLHYNGLLTGSWLAGLFMALAFVYFGLGQLFDRLARRTDGRAGVAPFALPFYGPGFLLSAIALAAAAGDRMTALYVFLAGVVLYALSAWRLREPVFLYPAAWLSAVPYFLAMTLTLLPPEWYGVGWVPLIVASIALGRMAFHRSAITPKAWAPGALAGVLIQPAMPFYLLGYGLSLHMVALSLPQGEPMTMAAALAAVLYFASAALFRRTGWLYPALLLTHLALATFCSLFPSDAPWYTLSLPFLGLTWALALTGYAFSRLFPVPLAATSLARRLTTASWARPFLAAAALDVIVWQAVSLNGSSTGMVVAAGFALLLGLFAFLWSDAALAYGAIGLAQVATFFALRQAGASLPVTLACFGGVGLGMYFLARLADRSGSARLAVWVTPLTRSSVVLTGMAVLAVLPTTLALPVPTAAALTFAGALYLALSYRGHYNQLGYLGAALLEAAWALVLTSQSVQQPQLYAIPAGVYFVAVGFLERRRAKRAYAGLIEGLGLAVLLVTSFIQSLNGAEGFPYFLLLLVEALLVIWWGAARRIRLPFFTGLGASVLNVLAQLVVLINVYDPNRFMVIFAAGLLLVIIAVFVERQRALIIARAREWRESLETWE